MFPYIIYPFSINSHCSGNSVHRVVISNTKAVSTLVCQHTTLSSVRTLLSNISIVEYTQTQNCSTKNRHILHYATVDTFGNTPSFAIAHIWSITDIKIGRELAHTHTHIIHNIAIWLGTTDRPRFNMTSRCAEIILKYCHKSTSLIAANLSSWHT